jgi:hypothetical protein
MKFGMAEDGIVVDRRMTIESDEKAVGRFR